MKVTYATKLCLTASLGTTAAATAWPVDDFDWNSLTPSSTLDFTPCYNDTHRCAKLQVPLDWLDASNDALSPVTLAIVTKPAAVARSDPSFGGTIITNPGGPGASGVGFILSGFGEKLQRKADSASKKYEILSFDPRGVGLSTPAADCHHGDEFARGVWKLENRAIGPVDGSYAAAAQKSARAAAFGQLCDGTAGEHGIQRFMSSASVARDMVRIVDELDKLLKESDNVNKEDERAELRREVPKPARILYWGFSYGSALGQYFASMFPGRVGRMILEGIVDIEDYSKSHWLKCLADTQETLAHLWTSCFHAQSRCALYNHDDRSPQDIEARFRDLLAQLDREPAPFVTDSYTITAITKQDVLGVVFQALYQPLETFPAIATVLNASMHGDHARLYSMLSLSSRDAACTQDEHPAASNPNALMRDAWVAIMCGDGVSRADISIPEIVNYINRLTADSPDFGADWARHVYECRGWTARPGDRYDGPWGIRDSSSLPSSASAEDDGPSAPILFMTSHADPVTPRENAFAAAETYSGSRVLVQNNVGHCVSDWPSRCTEGHVKRYLDTGELPPEGTVCEPDCKPFEACPERDGVFVARTGGWRLNGPLAIFH
ncbi:Alpha/Beta hydrolase protein [Microdochium bolleyi]|uniref:Alpha/Beta hydrolase protein n=1 Tax=Microdochium bolleyi TaxID=196109 RepID=A0A136IYI6_9PEZI|nr:Alpha/Beta hydrolase protein [Microdochium bolleyi]